MGFRWKVIFLISISYFVMGFLLQGGRAVLPFVQMEFGISLAQVGLYTTVMFFSASLFSTSGGWVVDRIGEKRSMVLGIGLMGLFFMIHSLAPSYLIMLVIVFFVGIGHSFMIPAATKGITIWVDDGHQATALGLTQAGRGMGGLIGASMLPFVCSFLGWRSAFLIAGVVSLFAAMIMLVFYKEKAVKTKNETVVGFSPLCFLKDLKVLFKKTELVSLYILGFIFGSVVGASSAHFMLFLHNDLKVTVALAGLGFGLMEFGGMIGRPIWGVINDRFFFGDVHKCLLFNGIVNSVLCILFGFLGLGGTSIPNVLIFFVAIVFGSSSRGWMGIYTAAVNKIVGSSGVGITIGMTFTFIRLGTVFAPILFGFLADKFGTYQYSWIAMGIGVLVSFLYTNLSLPKSAAVH